MVKVLVTGGAGFVGSVTVRSLLDLGYEVVVYDDLSKGHRTALPENVVFVKGNFSDKEELKNILLNGVNIVIHFAASIENGESMHLPCKYFENNVINTLVLLEAMLEANVKNLVFSSSAAVYGTPRSVPITEEAELRPTSPYGETKLLMEHLLREFVSNYGFRAVALRYFNAAGAILGCGEDHDPETHIIPNFIKAGLNGKHMNVFGDGSHKRDYVHVSDLSRAHVLSVLWIQKQGLVNSSGLFEAFNLGSGKMYSNLEIAEKIFEVIERKTRSASLSKVIHLPDRAGDPQDLLASNEKAQRHLGWIPNRSNIDDIITDALNWHLKFPEGFGEDKAEFVESNSLNSANRIVSVLESSSLISLEFKERLLSWLLKNEINTVRLIDYKSMSDEEVVNLVRNGFVEKSRIFDILDKRKNSE